MKRLLMAVVMVTLFYTIGICWAISGSQRARKATIHGLLLNPPPIPREGGLLNLTVTAPGNRRGLSTGTPKHRENVVSDRASSPPRSNLGYVI